MRLGYACINNTLALNGIKVNRSMVKKTFTQKGIPYASSLALQNIADLEAVIDWNIANDILLYRMSSDMFPWMSEYELNDLPDINEINKILSRIGEKVRTHGLRLTFHPGPFNVLASANESVVVKTIKELRQHAEIMNKLDLPASPFAKINIHVGGAYGDKDASILRFAENFKKLPVSAQKRLTVENDDKANLFSVKDLVVLSDAIGIPIVFDYLHHKFCTGNLSEEEAFRAAIATWPQGITPIVHYSSSKKRFEDDAALDAAHADFLYENVLNYNVDVDVMLEAKAKEHALIRYKTEFLNPS